MTAEEPQTLLRAVTRDNGGGCQSTHVQWCCIRCTHAYTYTYIAFRKYVIFYSQPEHMVRA